MGTGLFVYTSNRLEELAEAIAAVLGQAPLPPLATETILVPSQGLARWLRQDLARRFGIAAGLAMPFPGAWLQQLDRQPGPDPFALDVLRLRLWRLLGTATGTRFGAAADYCADDPDQRKRWQLADRLARTFDDYQLYRPELLAHWATGGASAEPTPQEAWQAALWRELRREVGLDGPPTAPNARRGKPVQGGPLLFPELAQPLAAPADTSARLARLQRLFADRAATLAVQPHRLSVFGAGTLPPALLQLFGDLAAHVEVHLFVPAPTTLYTGDVRSSDRDANSLFTRLGTEAREFAGLLTQQAERLGGRCKATFDLADLAQRPPLPADASLLQRLQQDLAELRARRPDGTGDDAPWPLEPRDPSLRVHVCHSPQREMEVVRDQILAAFRADPRLQPHDVLVLVPDIARYAPYANAVFGPVQEHLPFHVADKSPAADLPVCATLLAVLALAEERLEVHDVLRLLEQPAVQERFGIFAGDLPTLRARCARAGIRWGLDGAARARQFGVPAFDDNAWRTGLHRLLLGVATGPVDELVLGVMPVGDATAGREDLLARFLHFTDTVFAQLAGLRQPQPAAQWADRVERALDALFASTAAEDVQAVERVRTALAQMRAHAATARCSEPMHRVVLRDWLEQALGQAPGARGFLAGAVTVAALLPMRAVPVQHLFVCGLDDASFPRRDRPVPFDLIAAKRRPGDRSVRLDDRQMFLDVLMAARTALHLTYVGRSQKDNSPCAPSPVLAELLDHVDQSCRLADGKPARTAIVVDHPLQPWSRRYRDGQDERLFTFTRAELEPDLEGGPEPAFCAGPLTPPAELLGPEVALADLEAFWNHPARFFLQRVADLRLRRQDDADDTMEPFTLGHLERWQLQDETVRRRLRALPRRRDELAHARASGRLPVGGRGNLAYEDADVEVEALLADVQALGDLANRTVDVTIGGQRVRGELPHVAADCLLYLRVSKSKPKDHLRAWIRHVMLSLMRHQHGGQWPTSTLWMARDKRQRLTTLDADAAAAAGAVLLDGFRQGLSQPLPMLLEASYAFAEAVHKGKSEAAQRQAAASDFAGSEGDGWHSGDAHDADVHLCWRGREPLDDPAFATWARRLWVPILQHTSKA